MCTYLARARVEGKNLLSEMKEKQFITVGFRELPNLKGTSKDKIREMLERCEVGKKRLNQLTSSVHFFVNKMEEGDYCYLPDPKKTDDIYVIQVKSAYEYVEHDESPHRRAITFLNQGKPVSRTLLPQEVRKSLHTNLTIAHLKQHHDFTHNLIQDLQQNERYQYEKMKVNVPSVINKALESPDLKLQLQGAELALVLLEDWYGREQ